MTKSISKEEWQQTSGEHTQVCLCYMCVFCNVPFCTGATCRAPAPKPLLRWHRHPNHCDAASAPSSTPKHSPKLLLLWFLGIDAHVSFWVVVCKPVSVSLESGFPKLRNEVIYKELADDRISFIYI